MSDVVASWVQTREAVADLMAVDFEADELSQCGWTPEVAAVLAAVVERMRAAAAVCLREVADEYDDNTDARDLSPQPRIVTGLPTRLLPHVQPTAAVAAALVADWYAVTYGGDTVWQRLHRFAAADASALLKYLVGR